MMLFSLTSKFMTEMVLYTLQMCDFFYYMPIIFILNINGDELFGIYPIITVALLFPKTKNKKK